MDGQGRIEEDFARVGRWVARYFHHPEEFRVFPDVRPGEVLARLPDRAPEDPEAFEDILRDFERIVVPATTHWNHPRFFAYFATSADPAAVMAEALAATLDVKAMLWRTSPAATELETAMMIWLRRLIGLPEQFTGAIYDTASIAGFTALAAAREALGLDIRRRGATGRDLPTLRIYATEHTHSHVAKAAIALGVGHSNVVEVPCDERFRMRPEALESAIRHDLRSGMRPMAIVATVGTTSTTSVDPVPGIAAIAQTHKIWLHVDAAYAGVAGMLPEYEWLMEGCEQADSIVLNPHKWLFVPMDCSVLFVRDIEQLRQTFSLVPEYLRADDDGVTNYMDYGLQLGRRFRALKLWFVFRALGARRIRETLRGHVAMAATFASWVAADPQWEVMAPHPLSVVCFRHVPAGMEPERLDAHNAALLAAVNATGEIFISHTMLGGRYALRLAIGNQRSALDDVEAAWNVLRRCAESLEGVPR